MTLGYFPEALALVDKVSRYGATKYSHGGWKTVPDGVERYTEANLRHVISSLSGEECDPYTGFLHKAHAAWNALAALELALAALELALAKAEVERLEKLRKPVTQELYPGGWTQEAIADAAFKQPYHDTIPHGHELYNEEELAAWEEGEKRMDVVGQNGPTAEHYWQINDGVAPALDRGTRVMVEYRNGDPYTGEVEVYDWSLEDSDSDIIRWRLA